MENITIPFVIHGGEWAGIIQLKKGHAFDYITGVIISRLEYFWILVTVMISKATS